MAMSLAESTEAIPPIKVLKIQKLEKAYVTDVIAAGPDGTIAAGGRFQDHLSIYRQQQNGKYKKDTRELKLPGLNRLNANFALDLAMSIDGECIIARNGYVEIYHEKVTEIFYRSCVNFLYFGPYFGQVEDPVLEYPTCVSVLPNGCIVVGDTVKKAVIVHNPRGKKKKTITTKKGPDKIAAIDNTRVAIAKPYSGVCDQHGITVIDILTGLKVLDITCETVFTICYDLCFHRESNSLVVALPDHVNNRGYFLLQQYCVNSGRFRSHIDFGDLRSDGGVSVASVPKFGQAHSKLVVCDGYGINVFKVRLDLKDDEDANPLHKYSPSYNPELDMKTKKVAEKLQKELVDKAQRDSKLNKSDTEDISAKGVGKLHKRGIVDHRLDLKDCKEENPLALRKYSPHYDLQVKRKAEKPQKEVVDKAQHASKCHKKGQSTVGRAKGVGKCIKRGKEDTEGVGSRFWNIPFMIGLVCFLAVMLALYLYE